MKFSDLGKRLLFVFWAVPLGWWVVNSTLSVTPRSITTMYPGQLAIMFLTVMALFEYTRMLGIFYPSNGFWLSYLWIGLQFYLYFSDSTLPSTASIYILLILVAAEAFGWGRYNQRKRWVRASLLFSGIAFLHIASISMLNFYKEPFQSLFKTFSSPMLSQLGIVIVMGAIFLCDSSAYIFGSLFGKHHFSSISPKKTIEGSVAGMITSILVVGIGWYFLANPRYPWWLGITLGLLIGVFAQIGDLLVSLMKRYFRVKDASDIIPGHGGILDRFDSVFFTVPVVSLFSWIVNKIAG